MAKLLQQITREIGMSIPSISTFVSKYSNPITLQLLSHETLCSDFIICPLLKSLCEEVLAETHSVDRGLQKIKVYVTMWMFMLMMMVLTRARPEEDSRAPTNPLVAEGSASARVLRKNRRRKSKEITTTDSLAEPHVDQHVEQSAEQHANPPKRRGPSINHSVTRYLQNMPEGFKIPLTLDKATKAFIGTSTTDFATELGIIVRDVFPMRFYKWDSGTGRCENFDGKLELLRTDNVLMEYVNSRLHIQWKRSRGVLSQHWKNNGGKTNPRLARSNMHGDCRNQDDWNHLCDYWEPEKTRKYSDQMELNRRKQVNISRGLSVDSQSCIQNCKNPETQLPPSPLEVYYKLHYNANKKGWLNEDSRIVYDNICKQKEEAMARLNTEGTIVTTAMEHDVERKAIKSVCGRAKTIQSAWEVGVGPVLRKKDNWMKSAVESSQRDLTENEDLRNEVTELKEELKQSNEKYERVTEFLSRKYLDFESTISTNDAGEDDGLNGLHNKSDNTI
ncbi:putative transposase, Ptta/En/Spm, plant [Helianthus annuus]|nr:putative transposase, Ptta/En/Spm, plant [Helianthus annuus]